MSESGLPIQGHCDPRFARVREVFAEGFAKRGETGGGVAVMIDGELVVDLVGGFIDREKTRPWAPDTLVNLASATKGMLGIAVHRLVERGLLDLETPVARVWPEFARGGKERVTLAELLGHRAGLPALRAKMSPEAIFDWTAMTNALAAEAPWWAPGTQHGYHAMTIGWLLGELVRRVTGKTFGRHFAEEIAGPLGLDLHVGLSPAEEARVADVRTTRPAPGEPSFVATVLGDPDSVTGKAFLNPQMVLLPAVLNSHAWRAAELPFANGHGTASALATLYGSVVRRTSPLLPPSAVTRAATEQAYGTDLVLRETTRYGLGFMLTHPGAPFGRGTRAFGHPGAGGYLGFGDPDARLGFAYVTGKMGLHVLVDPRATMVADAVYASLG